MCDMYIIMPHECTANYMNDRYDDCFSLTTCSLHKKSGYLLHNK